MWKQPNVADYIVARLAQEGITDCFGVAGDFAFKLNDAVVRSERIRWIGCSNELDAAYAADGYARMRGCSMLMTTYAVGELSALNGVMGAKAERSCVFHLVGMPTMRNQRVGKIIHHTPSTTSGLAIESSTPCRWAISLNCWSSRCPRNSATLHRADRLTRNQAASRAIRSPRQLFIRAIETFSSQRT